MECIAVSAKRLWKTVPRFKASSSMAKRKVMARRSCTIKLSLKAHGEESSSSKAKSFTQTALFTKEHSKKVNQKAKE